MKSKETTFQMEHVLTGKREDVTQAQFERVCQLFPGTFRKVSKSKKENLSEEAMAIIKKAELGEEE